MSGCWLLLFVSATRASRGDNNVGASVCGGGLLQSSTSLTLLQTLWVLNYDFRFPIMTVPPV